MALSSKTYRATKKLLPSRTVQVHCFVLFCIVFFLINLKFKAVLELCKSCNGSRDGSHIRPIKLDHRAEVFARFCHCELPFFHPLHTVLFGRKLTMHNPQVNSGEYASSPWEESIFINYLEFFCMWDWSSLPQLEPSFVSGTRKCDLGGIFLSLGKTIDLNWFMEVFLFSLLSSFCLVIHHIISQPGKLWMAWNIYCPNYFLLCSCLYILDFFNGLKLDHLLLPDTEGMALGCVLLMFFLVYIYPIVSPEILIFLWIFFPLHGRYWKTRNL